MSASQCKSSHHLGCTGPGLGESHRRTAPDPDESTAGDRRPPGTNLGLRLELGGAGDRKCVGIRAASRSHFEGKTWVLKMYFSQ